jgi:hypothetical protein
MCCKHIVPGGRMRLALEIAVRSAWPAGKPLFFRISAVDWREDLDTRRDGWTIADSCTLARELAARGVDLIDCSSGGIRAENSLIDYAKRRRPLKRNYQVACAEAIRRDTGMPTMAVGAILDGPQAEAILQRGQADLIAVAREALVDPHWALHAAQVLGVDPDWTLWPTVLWLVARVAPAHRYVSPAPLGSCWRRWLASGRANLSVGDVTLDRLSAAFRRVAITTGTGRLDHQTVSRCESRHDL